MKRRLPPKPIESLPARTYSPPVRDTDPIPRQRKPLHAPTERQLMASQASKLRQLINQSKAALATLDSEIIVERNTSMSQRPPSARTEPSYRPAPQKRPTSSGGLLRPCVRSLGGKAGIGRRKQPTVRWAGDRNRASHSEPNIYRLGVRCSRFHT